MSLASPTYIKSSRHSSLSSYDIGSTIQPEPSGFNFRRNISIRSVGHGGFATNLQRSPSMNELLVTNNEKTDMQNLNDRLAAYLQKVHSLENENAHLEKQIQAWYSRSSPAVRHDYSTFYATIEDLQNQISHARLDNCQILLQIDNAKLAADDFRIKYETELSHRLNVESDTERLKKVMDDLTLNKSDLELQVENLREELAFLQKNFEEERDRICGQQSGAVSVQVDAAPGINLAKIMDDMRQQYEAMAEKNRQEAKEKFEKLVEEWNIEVTTTTHELESHKTEIKERRHKLQDLQIEHQSLLNWKISQENAVAEIEARYAGILAGIYASIKNLEAQLMQQRSDMEQHNQLYNSLLDVKIKLEAEIATYRRLLEGEDTRIISSSHEEEDEMEREKNRVLRIKTVVEEMVDGKVVSSEVKEREQKM